MSLMIVPRGDAGGTRIRTRRGQVLVQEVLMVISEKPQGEVWEKEKGRERGRGHLKLVALGARAVTLSRTALSPMLLLRSPFLSLLSFLFMTFSPPLPIVTPRI